MTPANAVNDRSRRGARLTRGLRGRKPPTTQTLAVWRVPAREDIDTGGDGFLGALWRQCSSVQAAVRLGGCEGQEMSGRALEIFDLEQSLVVESAELGDGLSLDAVR